MDSKPGEGGGLLPQKKPDGHFLSDFGAFDRIEPLFLTFFASRFYNDWTAKTDFFAEKRPLFFSRPGEFVFLGQETFWGRRFCLGPPKQFVCPP